MVGAGLCHVYAQRRAFKAIKEGDRDVRLVNATITEPFSSPPHSYEHSWVESRGVVQDWQTMTPKMGMGGKFRGVGWPVDVFYETFKPRGVKKFTPVEYLKFCRVKK
jgi:hypothetical protein